MQLTVMGIGSHAGDDRAGWLVSDRLGQRNLNAKIVRCGSPMELLDQLPSDGPLAVIDAVRSGRSAGTIHRLSWPAEAELADWGPPCSTHGLGLAAALALAERLGMLASPTVIWGIEVAATVPGAPLSLPVRAAVERIVLAIEAENAATAAARC